MRTRKLWIFPSERKRSLEEMYDLTLLCNKCKYCRFVFSPDARDHRFVIQCPRGYVFRHAAYYAEGTVEIARALIENRLEWSDTIAHILYTCTDCGHCEFWCNEAMRVYPLTLMEIMKETYVEKFGIPSYAKNVVEKLEKTKNPFGEPPESRFKWLSPEEAPPRKSEIMLFVGDAYAYRYHNVAKAAMNILRKLGVKFGLLYEKEYHSGYLLFRLGLRDKGAEFLEHNVNALNEVGAKKVVFLDPHDYRVFKKELREEGFKPEFEVYHFLEFIYPLIQEAKHRVKHIPLKVTYHDPCNLSRHIMPFAIWEPPREILRMADMEVVEMPRNMLNAFCCGAGGGVSFTFPDLMKIVANHRIEEAIATGVDTLVTSCPYCVWALSSASNGRIKVLDIIEIIDQMLM
ncbi:MAG: (Fe-S)-binding protein [Desulfurococcaceae archaeon]